MIAIVLWVMVAALFAWAAAQLSAVVQGCTALGRAKQLAASQDLDGVLLKSAVLPGISVICVAGGATAEWRAHVRRLLDLHFGKHEVVLVVDGVAGWIEELHLEAQERTLRKDLPGVRIRGCYVSRDPIRLLVVDIDGRPSAEAWNTGFNMAQYPVVGLLDAEADFIPEVMLRLIRPILEDERMMAVCGLAPGPVVPGLAGRLGALRTEREWLLECAAFGEGGKLELPPGACTLIRREAILAAGGFRLNTRELCLDLPAESRTMFVPVAVSWRRAAANWMEVRRQLLRTHSGQENALHAMVETAAYVLALVGIVKGSIPLGLAGLVLLSTAAAGAVISMTAVVMRELAEPSRLEPGEVTALFVTAIPENMGHRQLCNLWIGLAYIKGLFTSRTVH
jgi:hypothetical protein